MRSRILAAVTLLALVAAATPALAEPKITFSHTEHDFGRVYQNESLIHVFPFTNTGDKTLLIKEVKGS